MPNYQINTGTKQQLLGTFDTIEEVQKLRLFKDHPSLLKFLQEVPMQSLDMAKLKLVRVKKLPTERILRRRELKHLTTMLATLIPVRTALYKAEIKAKRLMNKDPNCGCNSVDTDHWVSISIGYDQMVQAIEKINKRIKQIKSHSVVE